MDGVRWGGVRNESCGDLREKSPDYSLLKFDQSPWIDCWVSGEIQ